MKAYHPEPMKKIRIGNNLWQDLHAIAVMKGYDTDEFIIGILKVAVRNAVKKACAAPQTSERNSSKA